MKTFFGLIRIGSDTDFELISNISDWFGMHSYPKLSPGNPINSRLNRTLKYAKIFGFGPAFLQPFSGGHVFAKYILTLKEKSV